MDESQYRENTRAKSRELQIFLVDDDNLRVWFENWSDLQIFCGEYLDKQNYLIYATLCGAFFTAVVLVYNIFFNTVINTFEFACLLYLVMLLYVLFFLIFYGFRFERLQRKTVTLVNLQRHFTLCAISDMLKDKDINVGDDEIENDNQRRNKWISAEVTKYKQFVLLMESIIKVMEQKPMIPKIAGLPIDKAFVRVLGSLTIALASSIFSFTYYRRF